MTCAMKDCDLPVVRRGFCNGCYQHLRKRGRIEPAWRPTAEVRFWGKVSMGRAGECWEWNGSRRATGHGSVGIPGLPVSAGAAALTLAGRPRPGKDSCALHHCDNPPCCNPDHLYWGTRGDNSEDAWSRGRMPVGSRRWSSKISEEQVLDIRRRASSGEKSKALSIEFGLDPSTISSIIRGHRWKHLGGPIKGKDYE